MRILITGGSGFIGTNLIEMAMQRNHTVISIDSVEPKIESHRQLFSLIDICDAERLNAFIIAQQPEYIIHLAARTDLNEKKDVQGYSANIQGVENLIKAIKQCGSVKRCIYISTQLVCQIGYIPQNETDYKPNTVYGLSKVMTEKIIHAYNGGGIEWCIVRPTTIWGPWMGKHYQKFIELVRRGKYFHIGNRNYMKSYGYVGNFCYQLLQLLEVPNEQMQGKTLYLADYTPLSLRKWAETFRKELHAPPIKSYPIVLAKFAAIIGDGIVKIGYKRFPLTSFRLNNIFTEYVYDLSPTQKLIPKLPYTIEQGVKETVDWYKETILEPGLGDQK